MTSTRPSASRSTAATPGAQRVWAFASGPSRAPTTRRELPGGRHGELLGFHGKDWRVGHVPANVGSLARAIVTCLLVWAAVACSPAPSPAPTRTSTRTPLVLPTQGVVATAIPVPTATTPPEPSVGSVLTLQDLDASFAYAVCQGVQCDVHVIDSAGVDRNVTDTPELGAEEH